MLEWCLRFPARALMELVILIMATETYRHTEPSLSNLFYSNEFHVKKLSQQCKYWKLLIVCMEIKLYILNFHSVCISLKRIPNTHTCSTSTFDINNDTRKKIYLTWFVMVFSPFMYCTKLSGKTNRYVFYHCNTSLFIVPACFICMLNG